MAAALISDLHADPSTDAMHKQQVENLCKEHKDVTSLGCAIPVLRTGTTHLKKTRVVMSFSHKAEMLELPNAMRHYMARYNAEIKLGEAPRGPVERRIMQLNGNTRTDAS